MSLTLDEVKNFLRLDTSDDDTLLEIYISTAEEYVKSACGRQVDLDNPKAHTVMLMLVGDYYETVVHTDRQSIVRMFQLC